MANFEKVGNQTIVMGEFALLEDEVNPVISELRKGKIEVSTLHNHMLGENPRIHYVHFQGTGKLDQLAQTVETAIKTTK